MGGASKAERLRYRLLAVDALRAVKELLQYSYKQLSREIGFDETLLARYSTGSTVPSYDMALRLISSIRRSLDPARIAIMKLKEYKGLLDLTPILTDPHMLRVLALEFYERFRGSGVSKILVPEASGITLATALSLTFNAPMVIARRSKDNPLVEYLEEHVVEPPSTRSIFFIPRGSIGRGDRVLIVDDIVQSGITLSVMKRLVDRSGAEVVGVASVVVVGDEWRKRAGIERVEALITIHKV